MKHYAGLAESLSLNRRQTQRSTAWISIETKLVEEYRVTFQHQLTYALIFYVHIHDFALFHDQQQKIQLSPQRAIFARTSFTPTKVQTRALMFVCVSHANHQVLIANACIAKQYMLHIFRTAVQKQSLITQVSYTAVTQLQFKLWN